MNASTYYHHDRTSNRLYEGVKEYPTYRSFREASDKLRALGFHIRGRRVGHPNFRCRTGATVMLVDATQKEQVVKLLK